MARYVAPGSSIDHTPGSALSAGDVVVVGSLVGIAATDIAAGKLGAILVDGVFEFPKAAEALSVGDSAYWDAGASNVTATASGNTLVGIVVAAAASGDAVASVLIR